jgi:hypothetical protein
MNSQVPKTRNPKASVRAFVDQTPKPEVPKSRKLQNRSELRKLCEVKMFFSLTLIYEYCDVVRVKA